METNPRARISENWAPPPPVAAQVEVQDVVPQPAAGTEDEFEEILGSLVEHYSTLPPATFGEPPQVTPISDTSHSTETRVAKSRVGLWIGLAAAGVLVTTGLVLGGVFLMDKGEKKIDPSAAVQPAVAQAAPVAVDEAAPEEPTAEPLSNIPPAGDVKEEATEEAAEPAVAADTTPAPPAAVKPAKKVTRKKVRKARKRARKAKRRAPVKAAKGSDWEDPYE